MSSIVVSGHQPNFFPWFGYFEKMLKSDIFVFSDDVQYPKQSYVNRVEILISNKEGFLSLPVLNKSSTETIDEKQYQKNEAVLKKIVKTIQFNLGGFECSGDLEQIIAEFSDAFRKFNTISELNIHMNKYIASLLGIETKFLLGVDVGLKDYHKNERLIQRCKTLNAMTYLCGQGAGGYQDDELLESHGIKVKKIQYDIGRQALGENLKYSILLAIAQKGLPCLRQYVADYNAKS